MNNRTFLTSNATGTITERINKWLEVPKVPTPDLINAIALIYELQAAYEAVCREKSELQSKPTFRDKE